MAEQIIPNINDVGFFKKQRLIAMANRGLIDPDELICYQCGNDFCSIRCSKKNFFYDHWASIGVYVDFHVGILV